MAGPGGRLNRDQGLTARPIYVPVSFMKIQRQFEQLRKLRELQRLGMTVAEDLHARAKVEKDPTKLVELTDAFLLVGEEVREAIALEAKLARDLDAALPDPGSRPCRRRRGPVPRLVAGPPNPTRH